MDELLKALTRRVIASPFAQVVNITLELVLNPSLVGRSLSQKDKPKIGVVLAYFISALSAAIVLTKIAHVALSITSIQDIPYWAFHIAMIVTIAVVTVTLALPLGIGTVGSVLTSTMLAFGGALLGGSFIFAMAAGTIWAAREAGQIPDVRYDIEQFANFTQAGMQAYFRCLRSEYVVFNALYNGLGGPLEELQRPIDLLSYLQPGFHLSAAMVFGLLLAAGTERRKVLAFSVGLVSSAVVFIGLLAGSVRYERHLHSVSGCGQKSIELAKAASAEDQVRLLAELFQRDIGKTRGDLTLLGVEAQQRTLVLRNRVTTSETFSVWIDKKRRDLVDRYCRSGWGTYYRHAGISQAWVFIYGDKNERETVVQNGDACRS